MSLEEKLLEGKYIYKKDDVQYSEEIFKVSKEDKFQGNFIFSSEILSRVATGEFLKIYTDYELSHQFEPLNVRVKRSLGNKKSTERFVISQKDKNLKYNFESGTQSESYEKIITGKFHIATPAFLTSALMTQIKKMDSVQKTPYTIISTNNVWSYEGPFFEAEVLIELKSLDQVQLEINDNKLSATHCAISDLETKENPHPASTEFYLSRYFNIPYKAEMPGNIIIQVDHLKTFEVDYKSMLK